MSIINLPKQFKDAPSEAHFFEDLVLDRSNVIDRVIDAIARESVFPETILLYSADNAVLVANAKDEDIQVIISSAKNNKIRVTARYFIGRYRTPVRQVFDSVDEVTTNAVRYLIWKSRMLTRIKVSKIDDSGSLYNLISRESGDLDTLDEVQGNVVSAIWDIMPDVDDLFIIENNQTDGIGIEVYGWGVSCKWVEGFNYVEVEVEKIRRQGVYGYADGEDEESIKSVLIEAFESATEWGEEYTSGWKYADNAPVSMTRKVVDLLLSPFQRSK
jgi:hypothetical protein